MGSKIRLLLIEDSMHDAMLLHEYFRTNYADEFEISHSINLKNGIGKLIHNEFDVIISDLTLPDSTGLDTFREVKKYAGDIPIIIHSGLDNKKLTIEAIRCGAEDYLIKEHYQGDYIHRVVLFSIERKKLETELEKSKMLIQKHAERLIELNDNLIELNKNKDKFYSIVAHDLLNPFNTLLGFSELLVDSFDEMNIEEIKEMSQNLNKQVKRILTLIKNLLEWTALSTGRIDFNPEIIELNTLLDELVEMHQLSAKQKNISLKYINVSSSKIKADKFMLETIFRNLITNAIKFTNPGGNIKVKSSQQNNSAVIEVEDTGIGMSSEDINQLFNIGETSSKKGTLQETGTGLGLILCRDFVIKNNGSMDVKSELGKGTTFVITFPLASG